MKTYKDSIAWQKSHNLVLEIYEITKKFPKEEMFGLTNQIRRAVVSISSNIAEGFSRKSIKEKQQFLHQALGSLTEVDNQILIARDVGYIAPQEFDKIDPIIVEVGKLINSVLKYLFTNN
jgi:four helix bundle protein